MVLESKQPLHVLLCKTGVADGGQCVNLGPICELVFYSQSSGNCCHDVAMTAFGELTVYSSVLTQGDKYCF